MRRLSCSIQDGALLAGLCLAIWFVFYRLGAYPANDDFLYARSVQGLVDEGRYVVFSLKGDVSPSAIFHVAWGTLVAKLFGFSYHSLHLAVLAQVWMGTFAIYWAATAIGNSRMLGRLLALSMMFCPFVFGHAFTFMTDAPAVAWSAVGLVAYLRSSQRDSLSWRFVGSLATLIAFAIRQPTLAVLIVPVIEEWFGRGRVHSLGRRMLNTLVATALPLIGLAVFELVLAGPGAAWRLGPLRVRAYNLVWLHKATVAAFGIGLLGGFFFLPLGPILLVRTWHRLKSDARTSTPALFGVMPALAVAVGFLFSGGRAYITNATGYFMQNAHFGPVILSDSYEPGRWGDMGGVVWPAIVWQFITIASIMNLAIVGATSVISIVRPEETASADQKVLRCMNLALLLVGLSSIAFLLMALEFTFDRYWMVMLAPGFVWASVQGNQAQRVPRWAWCASFVILAGLGAITLAFTHDFLAWNGARWEIVNKWLNDGATAQRIDGGYEINAWFRSAEDPATSPRPGDAEAGSFWWAGHADHFLVTAERGGFETIDRATWRSWATGRQHVVWGQRKIHSESN